MLSRRMDRSGVSEIVGALMLVLIVVVAASSFAVFISQKQNEVQAQQIADQRRALENVEVLSVTPTIDPDDASSTHWGNLTFKVANLYTERTIINSIFINGRAVQAYDVNRAGSPLIHLSTGDHLFLDALEQVDIIVDTSIKNWTIEPLPSLYDYSPTSHILTTNYLKMDIYTNNLNEFSRTFIPPTALAIVNTESQWDSSLPTPGYVNFLILDGSQSTAYGNTTYLVSWSWSITDGNPLDAFTLTGMKVRCNFPTTGVTYTITLTVTDNHGMTGQSTFTYAH